MTELWQLYDERGQALVEKGAGKDEVFSKGLLHGAAHVWIWRATPNGPEILLQRRGSAKKTWPNLLDISAAGHIDLGEGPLAAALRETKEELGIDVPPHSPKLITIHRTRLESAEQFIENEFQWLYVMQLSGVADFVSPAREVGSLTWKPFQLFRKEVFENGDLYVPHGRQYFELVVKAIESDAS